MLPRCSKKQKTAADADADAANVAQLPSDVLPGILLCLPASDLRRFRRVCKEWRDVISDLSFIDAHILHGPRAPTHTIVFYRGRSQADGFDEPLCGGGFLFDEQWRLTARFTVNESAEMIGTCNGLLCFRDSVHGVITVVEPFTGDSIVLPLPPTADARTCTTAAYCFGFDATTRRCKIVHGVFEGKVNYDGYFFGPSMAVSIVKQELHELTVGADMDWRTVRIGGGRHGVLYGDPACDDGAVYWYSLGYNDGFYRNVRFDLATERITSERRRLVRDGVISCRHSSPVSLPVLHFIGIRWFGEMNMEDGGWSKHTDAVAHETFDATQSSGHCLPQPHALQRGHLLLMRRKEGDLRAHAIVRSSASRLDIDYNWDSKPLVEIGNVEEEEPAERYRFFPVHGRRQDSAEVEVPIIGRFPSKHGAVSTFAYVPTVSPSPFALYLGTPLKDLHNL